MLVEYCIFNLKINGKMSSGRQFNIYANSYSEQKQNVLLLSYFVNPNCFVTHWVAVHTKKFRRRTEKRQGTQKETSFIPQFRFCVFSFCNIANYSTNDLIIRNFLMLWYRKHICLTTFKVSLRSCNGKVVKFNNNGENYM